MKTLENDNELRKLIKELKPDSPGIDFTQKVMMRVSEEKAVNEKVEKDKLLGWGFWIIVSLFVVLIAAFFAMSNAGIQGEGQFSNIFNGLKNGAMTKSYQSVFSNMGTLPLSIGGILLATSVLIFADRIFSELHIGVNAKTA